MNDVTSYCVPVADRNLSFDPSCIDGIEVGVVGSDTSNSMVWLGTKPNVDREAFFLAPDEDSNGIGSDFGG